MNTLDDLRATLDSHSHDAVDLGGLDHPSRRAQLQHRITVARRRRNAVRGTVAAAVVAAVVSVASLPHLLDRDDVPSVADRTTLGDVAPASFTALGLPYEFVAHTSSTTGTEVTLEPEPGGHPSLLSWTTTEPGATVTVTESGSENVLWSSDAGSFTDHVVLDQLRGVPVTVTSSTPGVAVALYEFDEDGEIAGVSSHGATFRQQVAGRGLLEADFAELGETRLRMTYDDYADEEISLAVHCSGLPGDDDAAVEARVNGEVVTAGSGCDDTRDHTGTGWVTFPVAEYLRDGALVLDVEIVRSIDDDRPVLGEHPDALLGAAFYEPAQYSDFEELLSDTTVEHSGHLWSIESDAHSKPADRLTADLDEAELHLVAAVQAGSGALEAEDDRGGPVIEIDGTPLRPTGSSTSVDGVTTGPTLVGPGAREVVMTPGTDGSVTGNQLLVWRLVD